MAILSAGESAGKALPLIDSKVRMLNSASAVPLCAVGVIVRQQAPYAVIAHFRAMPGIRYVLERGLEGQTWERIE